MTIEELNKVRFHETCHMALDGEYTTTYISEDGRIGICDHVPRHPQTGQPKGRAYRHWMIDGKVYKSKNKFIEALKNFE